ncbi:MAG: hypothetical protein MI757_14900 [Pirellulales bacterium]|nr:hypothetical protein [Pirellulales bacterium]
MRLAQFIVVVACVAIIGTSVAEAKKPKRIWHKRAKASKAKSYHAPVPHGAPTPVDESDFAPEILPDTPMADPLPPTPSTARSRWNQLLERTAERRTRVRQDRADRLRSLAARISNPQDASQLRDVPAPTFSASPRAIANAPTQPESSRRRSWLGRTAPQPVDASRPIANGFDIRRQAEQPLSENEAPRFDPMADPGIMSAPPAMLPTIGEPIEPPQTESRTLFQGQARQWLSDRFGAREE